MLPSETIPALPVWFFVSRDDSWKFLPIACAIIGAFDYLPDRAASEKHAIAALGADRFILRRPVAANFCSVTFGSGFGEYRWALRSRGNNYLTHGHSTLQTAARFPIRRMVRLRWRDGFATNASAWIRHRHP